MTRLLILILATLPVAAQQRLPGRPATPKLAIGISDPMGVVTPQILEAIQLQISSHFAPVWQRNARVFIGKGDWQVYVQLANPFPGAAGLHTTDGSGTPYALVSTQTVAGWNWTRVLSHEILEMLANPWGSSYASPSGSLIGAEVCDPVEQLSYSINGVEVSDFVTPTYFLRFMPGPWDYLGAAKPLWKP
jgi:hypothetical protein